MNLNFDLCLRYIFSLERICVVFSRLLKVKLPRSDFGDSSLRAEVAGAMVNSEFWIDSARAHKLSSFITTFFGLALRDRADCRFHSNVREKRCIADQAPFSRTVGWLG
jgi:hypothetical protein